MTAIPRMLTATAAAALVLTLSACGGGDGPDDGESEEVQLGPIDQLFEDLYGDYDEEDSNAEQMRVEELTAECMADLGFDYTPVDYSSMGVSYSSDDLDVEWGTLEFAEQYGYGATTNPWEDEMELPEETTGEWIDPNQDYVESMSETELEAYYAALYGDQSEMTEEDWENYVWTWEDSGCSGWAQYEVYGDALMGGGEDDEFAELQGEMNIMWESAANDPRMVEIEAEWAACMSEAGYPNLAQVGDAENLIYERTNEIYENAYVDMPPDATEEDYRAVEEGIQDQLSVITEQEIETAVADYTCREKIDYTKTQQDINLEYQQEFYDANKDELEAWVESMAQSMSSTQG